MDEGGAARLVRSGLERAWVCLRPPFEHQRVVGAEQVEERLGAVGELRSLDRVVDEVEGSEHIVGVFDASLGHGTLEDDLFRLVELELGALDPVGAVGLDERERRKGAG